MHAIHQHARLTSKQSQKSVRVSALEGMHLHTCIVDEDVQRLLLCLEVLHKSTNLFKAAHVQRHKLHVVGPQ